MLEGEIERELMDDLGIDGKVVLEWILMKSYGWMWIKYTWIRTGISGVLL